MNAVAPVRQGPPAVPPPPPAVAPADAPVLPLPAPGSLPDDPLSFLYLFESRDRQLGVEDGSKKLIALQGERHAELRKEQDAIRQAVDAEQQHGFWDGLGDVFGQIAKVAAVVASVAAAVATAGAAAPLAAIAIGGAVLSSAALVDGELHVLQKLGVDAKTAGIVDMGMSIGGAVSSVGAGIAAGARATSAATTVLERGGAVVAGLGQVGKGVSTIEAGCAQARDDQAAADQIASRGRSEHLQRMILLLLDSTRGSDEQSGAIEKTIVSAKTIQNDTMAGVTSMKG